MIDYKYETQENKKNEDVVTNRNIFLSSSLNQRLKILFFTNLKISALTFGGGYVIFSFLKKFYVEEIKIFTDEEMLNFLALAQSSPGPVALNIAILIGKFLAGIRGVFISLIGTILPPFIFLITIYYIFTQFENIFFVRILLHGLKIVVIAELLNVIYSLLKPYILKKDIFFLGFLSFFMILNLVFKVHLFIILGCSICIGIFLHFNFAQKLLNYFKKILNFKI